MNLALIWAQNLDGVIGHQGGLPFHVPEDLAHFKQLTMGHALIMGRVTWDALPPRFRPLPGRINVVLTTDEDWQGVGALAAHTPEQALDLARQAAQDRDWPDLVWVIGGARVYELFTPAATRAEVTVVDVHGPGDAYAPDLDSHWTRTGADPATGWLTSSAGPRYRFESWTKDHILDRIDQ